MLFRDVLKTKELAGAEAGTGTGTGTVAELSVALPVNELSRSETSSNLGYSSTTSCSSSIHSSSSSSTPVEKAFGNFSPLTSATATSFSSSHSPSRRNDTSQIFSDVQLVPIVPFKQLQTRTSFSSLPSLNKGSIDYSAPRQSSTTMNTVSLNSTSYLDLSSYSQSSIVQIQQTGRLPLWIQKYRNLETLICKGLNIKVLDEWVSEKLPRLKVIRLDDNDITTWPDHLSRLRNLQVLCLDGNPCLVNFREICPMFDRLYMRASGGRAETVLSIKEKITNSRTAKGNGSSIHSTTSSHSSRSRLSRTKFKLFGRKRSLTGDSLLRSKVDDDSDDEIFDQLTSLSPARIGLGRAIIYEEEEILEGNSFSLSTESTCKRYEQQTTSVLMALLSDIYLIKRNNGLAIDGSPFPASTSLKTSMHRRESNLSEKSLSTSSRSNSVFSTQACRRRSSASSTKETSLINFVEMLCVEERKIVKHFDTFLKIYWAKPTKQMIDSYSPLLKIALFHKNILLPAAEKALEMSFNETMSCVDSLREKVLEMMTRTNFLSLHEDYALNYEQIIRDTRTWINQRLVSNEFGGVRKAAETGDYIRFRSKKSGIAASEIGIFLELPFRAVSAWSRLMVDISGEIAQRFSVLNKTLETSIPRKSREKTLKTATTIFKLSTNPLYGEFFGEAVIFQEQRLHFELDNTKAIPDVVLNDNGKLTSAAVVLQYNNARKLKSDNLFRLFIFDNVVLIGNEATRKVDRQIGRRGLASGLADEGDHSVAVPNIAKYIDLPAGRFDYSPTNRKKDVPSEKIVKLVFADINELWYVQVRHVTGDSIAMQWDHPALRLLKMLE